MSTYLFETDEHKTLRESARRFAAAEIAPNALAWEEACEFPRSLYATMAEAGLLGGTAGDDRQDDGALLGQLGLDPHRGGDHRQGHQLSAERRAGVGDLRHPTELEIGECLAQQVRRNGEADAGEAARQALLGRRPSKATPMISQRCLKRLSGLCRF